MAVNIGRKKIDKLYKGSQQITSLYKGGDILYKDLEAFYSFSFVIDTRLKVDGTLDNSLNTFFLQNGVFHFKVYWGDGTEQTFDTPSRGVDQFRHVYSIPGEYTIKIVPTDYNGLEPVKGWLSSLQMGDSNVPRDSGLCGYKIKKFLNVVPAGGIVVTPTAGEVGYSQKTIGGIFGNLTNIEEIPVGFLDNIEVTLRGSGQSSAFAYMFGGLACSKVFRTSFLDEIKTFLHRIDYSELTNGTQMFYGFLEYAYKKNTDVTIPSGFFSMPMNSLTNCAQMFMRSFYQFAPISQSFSIPADLFGNNTFEQSTSFSSTFAEMFCECNAYYDSGATIPEGLFSHIETSSATSMSGMFKGTFQGFAKSSRTATIPDYLFHDLNFSSCTNYGANRDSIFMQTFDNYGYYSNVLTIPEFLFPEFTFTPSTTSTQYMFEKTFYYCGFESGLAELPSNLFRFIGMENVLSTSRMFRDTFHCYGYRSPVLNIPSDFFSTVNTSNVTNASYMFESTFESCGQFSIVANIPYELFFGMDTSNCVDISGLFYRTFSGYGAESTVGDIPSGIFDTITTSLATNMNSMFKGTFSGFAQSSTVANIHDDIFWNLDMSSATNVGGMFDGTFNNYGGESLIGTIPSGIFDCVDVSHATSMGSMFYNTFTNTFAQSPVATIPDYIFSFDTSSILYFNSTFWATFSGYGKMSEVITIPEHVFDIDTSNALEMQQTFQYCFSSVGRLSSNQAFSIPANLFSSIDTSNATKLSWMFSYCFSDVKSQSTTYNATIPATLFSSITISPACTDASSMFKNTFSGYALKAQSRDIYPAGLFATIAPPTTAKIDEIFRETFWDNDRQNAGGTLNDVFQGNSMAWATETAVNTKNIFYQMFRGNYDNYTDGAASTIIGRFDFTPSNRTLMFYERINLSDYNSINVNWK